MPTIKNIKLNIFWFRRDLRLNDNLALNAALNSGLPVLPVFIFDTNIIDELQPDDPRITFIYETLFSINKELNEAGSSLLIMKGDPVTSWKELILSFDINAVYVNKDYEPYSVGRDSEIEVLLGKKQISFLRFKDQVIFEENEILKSDKRPYTIFTAYRNKWFSKLKDDLLLLSKDPQPDNRNFYQFLFEFPSLEKIEFRPGSLKVRPFDLSSVSDYEKYRDFPSLDKTSYLGPHLRFGTVSIRKIARIALKENLVFLNELIWREFFMQILFHFPNVVTENFKTKYDNISWRNNEKEFERWCRGETGYLLVDAGMRQLNETGYMHNRVRMVAAGFLCKHLLTDWRWGEAYFAGKLLDYELSSNNGNWQWAAGTGSDAAPFFRVFNPYAQQNKFDHNNLYIKKWCGNFEKPEYPEPIVEHDFARKRAIEIYRKGIK
jgi:deoxyribodipyrimidine photo-lyase